jgi:hypothetical protein
MSKAQPIAIRVRCGQCVFLHDSAFMRGEDGVSVPCAKLGVGDKSEPCQHFTVNPRNFDFLSDRASRALQAVLDEVSVGKLAAFAALLNQEVNTRKLGFRYGEKVFVRIFTGEYISNYALAKVVLASDEHVFVQGKSGFRAMVQHGSVLKLTAWEAKRKELLKARAIDDPNMADYLAHMPRKRKRGEYQVPTIDSFAHAIDRATNDGEDAPTITSRRMQEIG